MYIYILIRIYYKGHRLPRDTRSTTLKPLPPVHREYRCLQRTPSFINGPPFIKNAGCGVVVQVIQQARHLSHTPLFT